MKTANAATKTAETPATETKAPMSVVNNEAATEQTKEPTLNEVIERVENLKLLVTKRENLLETRDQLERFRTASNDFNCTMRLTDTDGNAFNTTFTPGIKKVIDFLRKSFDESIEEVEQQIRF